MKKNIADTEVNLNPRTPFQNPVTFSEGTEIYFGIYLFDVFSCQYRIVASSISTQSFIQELCFWIYKLGKKSPDFYRRDETHRIKYLIMRF